MNSFEQLGRWQNPFHAGARGKLVVEITTAVPTLLNMASEVNATSDLLWRTAPGAERWPAKPCLDMTPMCGSPRTRALRFWKNWCSANRIAVDGQDTGNDKLSEPRHSRTSFLALTLAQKPVSTLKRDKPGCRSLRLGEGLKNRRVSDKQDTLIRRLPVVRATHTAGPPALRQNWRQLS